MSVPFHIEDNDLLAIVAILEYTKRLPESENQEISQQTLKNELAKLAIFANRTTEKTKEKISKAIKILIEQKWLTEDLPNKTLRLNATTEEYSKLIDPLTIRIIIAINTQRGNVLKTTAEADEVLKTLMTTVTPQNKQLSNHTSVGYPHYIRTQFETSPMLSREELVKRVLQKIKKDFPTLDEIDIKARCQSVISELLKAKHLIKGENNQLALGENGIKCINKKKAKQINTNSLTNIENSHPTPVSNLHFDQSYLLEIIAMLSYLKSQANSQTQPIAIKTIKSELSKLKIFDHLTLAQLKIRLTTARTILQDHGIAQLQTNNHFVKLMVDEEYISQLVDSFKENIITQINDSKKIKFQIDSTLTKENILTVFTELSKKKRIREPKPRAGLSYQDCAIQILSAKNNLTKKDLINLVYTQKISDLSTNVKSIKKSSTRAVDFCIEERLILEDANGLLSLANIPEETQNRSAFQASVAPAQGSTTAQLMSTFEQANADSSHKKRGPETQPETSPSKKANHAQTDSETIVIDLTKQRFNFNTVQNNTKANPMSIDYLIN